MCLTCGGGAMVVDVGLIAGHVIAWAAGYAGQQILPIEYPVFRFCGLGL